MPVLVHTCLHWVRRHLPGRLGREAYQELAVGGLLLAGAGGLAWYAAALPVPLRAGLWALLVLAAAVLARRGWLRLFGPLLVYDLVRTARRRQYVFLRCGYVVALLAVLLGVHAAWVLATGRDLREVLTGAPLDRRLLADFASSFFLAFLAVQFLAGCLLTPAYTAGAVAEEKERNALELLLTTDLRGREIVLGMAASRLANLLLVILAGLPVLSLTLFVGGVDAGLLAAGFAVTALSMLSLTALGVLVSVYAHRPRQAVIRTYGWAAAYLVVSGLSWLLLLPSIGWAAWPSTATWASPVTLEDVVEWFNAGNPVALAVQLWLGVNAGKALDSLLPGAVAAYAWFHGLTAVVLIGWAAARLRTVALRPPPGAPRFALPGTRRRYRPRVGRRPMLWKELWAERGPRLRSLGRITLGLLVPFSFLPVAGLLYFRRTLADAGTPEQDDFTQYLNLWVRATGTVVACGMLVAVALRAAAAVSGERDHRTLDGLLSTPLGFRRIFLAKWVGSIAGPRWAWVWLGLIAGLGVAMGALDFRAVPGLLAVWLVFAAFLASLGLWFSVRSVSTHRATFGTLLAAAAGFTAGHWLVWALLAPAAAWLAGSATAFDWFADLQTVGLTPPLALALLALPAGRSVSWLQSNWELVVVPVLRGLSLWATGAVVVGLLAGDHFRATLGRPPRWTFGGPRRRRLVVGLAALAPLALLAGWYSAWGGSSGRYLRQAIAEADELDPGWRLEDLEAKRATVADAGNGALQVEAIPDERTSWRHPRWYPGKQWPSQELGEALNDLAPEVRLNDVQRRLLTENLEDVEPALVEARRLADYPRGRYPIEYKKDGVSTLLPHVQRNRTIAGLLTYDALLRAEEGDADGALASCRAAVNAGRSLGDEPAAITQLVRLACRGLALAKIERALAQGSPSEAALAATQRLLEEDERDPVLLIAARGERALRDRYFEAVQTGAVSWREVLRPQWYDPGIGFVDRALLLNGTYAKVNRAALLRFTTALVEAAKLPPGAQDARFHEVAAMVPELPLVARAFISSPEGSWLLRTVEAHRRGRALARCTAAMLAAERYRRTHGRWPGSLDDLVPGFLPQVPTDPYDGNPLRYRRLADGVVIYALGPDGQDDGGKLNRTGFALRQGGESKGVDLGIRLWDPDRRRRPAPQPPPTAGPQQPPAASPGR
jgi:ABC-type transport system involved in multi-copper enzyme maturation permease subunit